RSHEAVLIAVDLLEFVHRPARGAPLVKADLAVAIGVELPEPFGQGGRAVLAATIVHRFAACSRCPPALRKSGHTRGGGRFLPTPVLALVPRRRKKRLVAVPWPR